MSNLDKNIGIFPNTGAGSGIYPEIRFVGSGNNPISLYVKDNNDLSISSSGTSDILLVNQSGLVANRGNFVNSLTLNNIPVSISGHVHSSNDISSIQFKAATENQWNTNNPVLASGEPGYESDTGRFKIGNGSNWNSTNYTAVVPSGFVAGTGISISLGPNGSTATITSTGSGVLSDQAKSLITTVFNNTGSSIPKMTAVYINGGQGDTPTIQKAIATTDAFSAGTYGLTYQNIDNMSTGQVIVFGALTELNTDQFNPTSPQGNINGTVLYLSPTTSGALTVTKPSAPNHIVAIGTVVRTHQNEGVIEVRVQNGFELDELHNVAISGVTNGQFLQYNSASGLWLASSSGNFTTLQVNGTGVSVSGHSHGNITSSGTIGSTSDQILVTAGGGLISTSSYAPRASMLYDTVNDWDMFSIIDTTPVWTQNAIDSDVPNLFRDSIGAADSNSVVRTTGDQSIDGIKQFNKLNIQTYSVNNNSTSGIFSVISSESNSIFNFEIKGGGNTRIGNPPQSGGASIHKLAIKGDTDDEFFGSLYIVNDSNQDLLFVRNDRRVGIGTSVPNSQLHVIGTGLVSSVTGTIPNSLFHLYSATSGANIFNVEGTNGSLFSVVDSLSGSLMSVNNSAGLPVFEVFSDNRVIAGRFNQNDFVITSGGSIGIGTSTPSGKLHVVGNTSISGLFSSTSGNFTNGLTVNGNTSISGTLSSTSGNFTNSLTLNGSGVSVSGHTHTTNDITNFNSGVSGLLPTIANNGDNRILTSTGSNVGINAENNLTFNGSKLLINGQLSVDNTIQLDSNRISITVSNEDLILSPNSIGALRADIAGNTRGIYSNDFQRSRVSASGVAAGGYSVICGGSDNRTINSYSIVCGGQTNTASNAWSIVCGGDQNTASGNRSVVVGGGSNSSSGQSSSVGGGSNNQATGAYSIVPGGFRAKATRQGELSHGAGHFTNTGDAQHSIFVLRKQTTDDTPNVVLTLNGLSPASTNILDIPEQTSWTFNIKISAYNLTNNEAAWWIIRGGIRRNNANSTAIVGSLISENGAESSLSTASATVVANDTDDTLEIRVTGVSGKSIRWVAVVDISQVSFGII